MTPSAPSSGMTVIASMRYRNVPAAIDWLCKAFGFERHLVVTDNTGGVKHATLKFGNGMILVDPVQKTESGKVVSITENGHFKTQNRSLVVADIDAHYARIRAIGAHIVIDIKDEDSGGRGYACQDL